MEFADFHMRTLVNMLARNGGLRSRGRSSRRMIRGIVTALAVAGAMASQTLFAEPESSASSTEALARQVQNPLAKLVKVPFQNNFNFGIGPEEATQWILDVEPVIPVSLNDDWSLITRTVIPIIDQPSVAPGIPAAFGLGDLNPSFYLSPAKDGQVTWGAGPTFTLPTATDSSLGAGMWSVGPALIAVTTQGPWVAGVLANQQWSFAGWGSQKISAMTIQPFINYNLPAGWYLNSAPVLTANWRVSGAEAWTVPLGGGIGKVFHLGRLPLNGLIQAYYNVRTPENGPDWQLRVELQLLFPK
ncbi:MAG TPA: neuromedin U [Verrucomicrobiales bacterium]|nr:neuromedin U [Verrucomicrobiales bacterium]